MLTEHILDICSSETVKTQLLQLSYNLTADLDAQRLLEFSEEVLPIDQHRQVRAFLADKYPILLVAAERERTSSIDASRWSDCSRATAVSGC